MCRVFRYDANSSVHFDNVPDGTTSIERSDWGKWGVTAQDKTKITSLRVPHTVTTINRDAFRGFTALVNMTLPRSVTSTLKRIRVVYMYIDWHINHRT